MISISTSFSHCHGERKKIYDLNHWLGLSIIFFGDMLVLGRERTLYPIVAQVVSQA